MHIFTEYPTYIKQLFKSPSKSLALCKNKLSPQKKVTFTQYIITVLPIFLVLQYTPAKAFQINKKESVVSQLTKQGVEPLIADCAAHAYAIVPISPNYKKIDCDENDLHAPLASIEIWNKAFDSKKQRIEVDKIVTIQCKAEEKNRKRKQGDIKLRCGYVKNMLLAFDFFDPINISKKK